MKNQGKRVLTDLEKVDGQTGRILGGIALESPGFGSATITNNLAAGYTTRNSSPGPDLQ